MRTTALGAFSLLLLVVVAHVLGTPLTSSTRWRCRRHADRCAVLYHAFVPSNAAAAFPPSPHLLMAAVSASTLQHAAQSNGSSNSGGGSGAALPFQVILATNAPRAAIERFRSAWIKAAADDATTGDIAARSAKTLTKDEAETFAFVAKSWDATTMSGSTRKRLPPWPFHDVALYPVETVYTLKAIAFDATVVAGAPGSNVATLSTSPLRFERTMFLDSDTLVRASVESAFDALMRFDVAAVGELASFSSGAAFVYGPLLNASHYYHPHFPAAKKNKKFKPEYKSFAAYEQQYNTGLVAYRSTAPCVRELIRRWAELHVTNPVCRKDVVAWDQCSFPWALRGSRVRVATLPERLNFRRSLGQACSAELQNDDKLERAVVVHEVKPGLKALVRLVVAPVLLASSRPPS